MKTKKQFYYYRRNGIIYYVSLDPKTRKKRVAKSTRTRDLNKAQFIMWNWHLSEMQNLRLEMKK